MSFSVVDGVGRDWVRRPYLEAIRQAGGIPVLLANLPESVEILAHCHGLLLTGGSDFDPVHYGEVPQGTDMDGVVPERDHTELALLHRAEQLDMPVFGICRGIQALAVGLGGRLIQDIPRVLPQSPLRHQQTQAREEKTHSVRIAPDSRLRSILGKDQVAVNSFHHQAVAHVPAGWRAVAWAEDGVIEAMEHESKGWFGVQWHPEDLFGDDRPARALFEHFVAQAHAYQVGRTGEMD